jgi:hypothetical protein
MSTIARTGMPFVFDAADKPRYNHAQTCILKGTAHTGEQ